jgi:hypothetical protein
MYDKACGAAIAKRAFAEHPIFVFFKFALDLVGQFAPGTPNWYPFGQIAPVKSVPANLTLPKFAPVKSAFWKFASCIEAFDSRYRAQ